MTTLTSQPVRDLAPGTRVRMTPAGIERDSGSIDRARTGVVVGYERSFDGRRFIAVRRDGQSVVGRFYEDSWEPE